MEIHTGRNQRGGGGTRPRQEEACRPSTVRVFVGTVQQLRPGLPLPHELLRPAFATGRGFAWNLGRELPTTRAPLLRSGAAPAFHLGVGP